jgi:hypothetical protein
MVTEDEMRWVMLAGAMLGVTLGGCVSYHHEVTALRMPRPNGVDRALADFVAPSPSYPSVGGDILKGTSPRTEAPDNATVDEPTAPPPGLVTPVLRRKIAHSLEAAPGETTQPPAR